jgi:hypothetical protein
MSVKIALSIIRVFGVFFIASSPAIADDDDLHSTKKQVELINPIHLDVKVQALSGIETTVLVPANNQSEFIAYGSALTIQPLINLHHRYQLAQTEHNSAKAKYMNAAQNNSRQHDLYQNGIASKRSLQGHQLQLQVDKALEDAASVQGKAIFDEALLLWGKELTDWALSKNASKLNDFLSGRQLLLKITLPAGKHLENSIQTIAVEPSGDRSKAFNATLIGLAPQNDYTLQGESYFFMTSNPAVKTGMRVAAWIPEQNKKKAGVIIPKSALIWHLDQCFVYIKNDQQTFSRRKIDNYAVTPNGYFISNELKPGEELVKAGGQLLLSEEFRVQIPDEDSD